MDIRTKLIFALVAVAVASMIALGTVMYLRAADELRESQLDQLDALAEARKDGLQQTIAGWRDRVRLIASRTQLRLSLDEHNRTGSDEASARIARILEDARRAVGVVEALAVYDVDGRLVASVPEGAALGAAPAPEIVSTANPDDVRYEGITIRSDGSHRASMSSSLELEGQRIGALRVGLNAGALTVLTRDRTGLGQSGQIMVVLRDTLGIIHALSTPAPDSPTDPSHVHLQTDASELVRLALEGQDSRQWEGLTDNSGNEVWAAVRQVPETGWGVVVKVDAEEARVRMMALRENLLELATALGGFAILFGTFLGFRFAGPIHDLAKVAKRIGEGDLSVRAQVLTEDEVGLLARTMNQMAEDLEQQVTLLRESERFFEVSLDMLCIAGTDAFFKRVNPAFEKTLGWSTEELLKKPFVDFVHPDDVEATNREIAKLAQGIPTISFENRFLCADGSHRHLLWASYPDPDTGLLYAVARDVTELDQERKQAGEQLRTVQDRLKEVEAKLRGGP